MSLFEFVTVMISMILALSLGRLLRSASYLAKTDRDVIAHRPYTFWFCRDLTHSDQPLVVSMGPAWYPMELRIVSLRPGCACPYRLCSGAYHARQDWIRSDQHPQSFLQDQKALLENIRQLRILHVV